MYNQPEEEAAVPSATKRIVIETNAKEKPEEVKDEFKVVSIEELDANSKNDACKPVPLPYIEEKKPEPISTPDLEYHDMHFSVSYIGNGINLAELNTISALLGNTRVKVNIEVCSV